MILERKLKECRLFIERGSIALSMVLNRDRFRWVALQLDPLCDNEQIFNPKDVEARLESLPATLEATYTVSAITPALPK